MGPRRRRDARRRLRCAGDRRRAFVQHHGRSRTRPQWPGAAAHLARGRTPAAACGRLRLPRPARPAVAERRHAHRCREGDRRDRPGRLPAQRRCRRQGRERTGRGRRGRRHRGGRALGRVPRSAPAVRRRSPRRGSDRHGARPQPVPGSRIGFRRLSSDRHRHSARRLHFRPRASTPAATRNST